MASGLVVILIVLFDAAVALWLLLRFIVLWCCWFLTVLLWFLIVLLLVCVWFGYLFGRVVLLTDCSCWVSVWHFKSGFWWCFLGLVGVGFWFVFVVFGCGWVLRLVCGLVALFGLVLLRFVWLVMWLRPGLVWWFPAWLVGLMLRFWFLGLRVGLFSSVVPG